jgi:glutamyl-tRNA synthetase
LTPSPAAIDFAKLDHFNATHIRRLPTNDLAARIKPYFLHEGLDVDDQTLLKIVPLIRERLVTLDDCLPFAGWFFEKSIYQNPDDLIGKDLTVDQSMTVIKESINILGALPDISPINAEPPMRDLVDHLGLKPTQVFGILRAAVTGQIVSPPLFDSMGIVGKEKVLERLNAAINILRKM